MDISQVETLIFVVRGLRVMLDEDLARLYDVPTKQLNKQVRRNNSYFPGDFLFRLTAEESAQIRAHTAAVERGRGKHRKYWPLAFTQEGVAMLSTVLRSPRAREVNIAIMRAFVKMNNAQLVYAGLTARLLAAEQTLIGLEKEQGEHATAIHELFAEFRRLARKDG